MPRGKSRIIIWQPDQIYIWINNKDYSDYVLSYEFRTGKNLVGEFSADLIGVDSTVRTDVAEGNEIQFRIGSVLLFKGVIGRPDYKTYEFCTITGLGVVENNLKNITVSSNRTGQICDSDSVEGRPIYTGTTSGVASDAIIRDQLSGTSTVSLGTNDYIGHVVARSDNDSVLSFVDGLVRNLSGVWYSSHGDYPYSGNNLNVAVDVGTKSSQKTFAVSGSDQNANQTNREVDEESLATSVIFLGYGDGENQLRSKVYHATDNFTRLANAIGSTDTTISVDDASVLPASGTVWIGMEQVVYTGQSGNDLTGCTRATKNYTDANNQTYLAAYEHSRSVAVYDAQYTESSTDGNSKIDANGLKQVTYSDKRVINQDALDLAGVDVLVKSYDPKERITLVPSDMYDGLKKLVVGDNVTVTDVDSGCSGQYEIIGQIVKSNEGLEEIEYELSNSRLSLTQDLRESQQEVKVGSQFMQGSTTAFNVQSYENCDADNPLNIRVYLPPDLIKVNKGILSFKTEDYRAYQDINLATVNNTTAGWQTGSESDLSGVWTKIDDITGVVSDCSFTFFNIGVSKTNWSAGQYYANVQIRINNNTDSEQYPDETGIKLQIYSGDGVAETEAKNYVSNVIVVPKDISGDDIDLELKIADIFVSDINWFYEHHSADVPYGISEEAAGSDATVDVDVGADGSEERVASGTGIGDTNELDISDWIASGVTLSNGGWANIKITPSKKCRIEANAFIKCFIQSK